MMMSQERAFLKARQQLLAMQTFVEQAVEDEQRVDQVERELFSQLLAVGLTLLTAFVAAQGDGDAGPQLETADGRLVRRLKQPRPRRYLSIFGELLVRRRVYRREACLLLGGLGFFPSAASFVAEAFRR